MCEILITEGTVLECTYGTKTSVLKIPEKRKVLIHGLKQATIGDCIVGKNILSFCECKRQASCLVCIPSITMKWIKGQENYLVEGECALLSCSILPCMKGGIIKIKKEVN